MGRKRKEGRKKGRKEGRKARQCQRPGRHAMIQWRPSRRSDLAGENTNMFMIIATKC